MMKLSKYEKETWSDIIKTHTESKKGKDERKWERNTVRNTRRMC